MSKVAVVIPLYNKVNTVARTILSARDQTYQDLEIVVVDDGSTDDPEQVVLETFDGDARCSYVRQENAGVAHTRNNGVFKHTTAPYVMCLDSDDAIEPGYIENLVPHLERDQSLGIVYTALRYIKPDGSSGVSPWPNEFDPDEQMTGVNQVPTAALTTRVMWERLGGQRQRYAPLGAGSEDGDFWTRAVSYGFGAKYVHPGHNGFFIYSWLSGLVSGNPDYHEVDFRAWSPWTKNYALMPTPSFATPKLATHTARQYDEPSISIIIPVGPDHAKLLINCLDSLDAQVYKRWEAIVVFDISSQEFEELRAEGYIDYLAKTWPFCRFTSTADGPHEVRADMLEVIEASLAGQPASTLASWRIDSDGPVGAGAARNIGIEMARAPLLMFLDADDWLVPEALSKMVGAYKKTGDIIYTDHMAVAHIKEEELNQVLGKVLAYSRTKQEAYIHQTIAEYDCRRAMEQPYTDGRPPYVICNISSLVPKKWVEEVGRFNTDINSWEDVLLFWMLAWRGKCFTRVPEPLLVYRYGTGRRRELGRKNARVLLEYLDKLAEKEKREGRIMGGCGCKGGGQEPQVYIGHQFGGEAVGEESMVDLPLSRGGTLKVIDEDVVLIEFDPPDRGGKLRYGLHQFPGGLVSYGHKGGGEQFYVHVMDIEADKTIAQSQGRGPMFIPISEPMPSVSEELEEVKELAPPPEITEKPIHHDMVEELDKIHGGEELVNEHLPDEYGQLLTRQNSLLDPDDAFAEEEPLVADPKLADLDIDLASVHRFLATLAEHDLFTVFDVLAYERDVDGGLQSIDGIGPKAKEAILSAALEAVNIAQHD